MVTVPALVWRYGPLLRGLIVGMGLGGFLGALAWLDSGFAMAGVIAFVAILLFYGGWMSRRMTRHWPSAAQLTGLERERVVSAARSGLRIDDPQLVPALTDYCNGLHNAAEESKPFRWVLWFVLVVAIGTAVWDGVFGSWGNLVVSVIYLLMLVGEVFWWPKRRAQLLGNADRAVELSSPPN
jgi:hypothetical protein